MKNNNFIRKRYVYIFYTIILLFLVSLYYNKLDTIFSIAIMPIILFIMINCLKNKFYMYILFLGMVSEIYYVIFFVKKIVNIPETSWRYQYDITYYNYKSLKYIMISILIISIIYLLYLAREHKNFSNDNSIYKYNLDTINWYIFQMFYLGVLLYYIISLNNIGLRNYAQNNYAANMILIFFRVCFLTSIILYNFTVNKKFHAYLKYEIFMGTIIAILLIIKGYRYILFETFVVLFFLGLSKLKKIKIRNLIIIAIVLCFFYFVLVIIKSHYIGRDIHSLFFNHEKNLFYSFNAIIKNVHTNLHTYTSTIKNLLPKAITKSRDLNTGGILMQYISKDIYKNERITMGGFYLAEAYANFRGAGIYLINVIISFCIVLFELKNKKHKGLFFCCLYIFLLSQLHSVVYYGSSNYLKLIVYYIMFTFIITYKYKV